MKFNPSALAACTAAALALTTGHAVADTLKVNFTYLGPSYDYTATLATPSQSITASPFLVSNLTTASSFTAFCIEPFVPLSASTQALGNTTYSAATAYNVALVKTLYNGYYGNALSTPTEAAAFQFALWELVAESSGPPNMTSGSFAFANGADPAVARAQQMISNVLPAGGNFNLFSYTTSNVNNDRSQNVLTATPVPEPATYAMMAAGLALVGAAVRRMKG